MNTIIDRSDAFRKMQSADQRIEALAKRHQEQHGGTLPESYVKVLEQPEGRRLYSDLVAAQRGI